MLPEPGTEVTILVVDDDSIDRRAIRRVFQHAGPRVRIVEANDGEEALEILQGDPQSPPLPPPYLVLLDLNMPRMNGHEFLERIRAEPSLKETIVFVMTTSSNQSDISRAYDKHVAGYLTKQEGRTSFREKIDMLLSYAHSVEFPAR